MNALVFFEIPLSIKALATLSAVVRPLSCVNEMMLFEMSLLSKALATLSAVVPPLSCVDALMQLERGAEAFVTQRVGESSGFLCGRGGGQHV